MSKFTIVLLVVALVTMTFAKPQVDVVDGESQVNVIDGDQQVNVVDGDQQVNVVDPVVDPRSGGNK